MFKPTSIYCTAIYYATIHYTKAMVLLAVTFGLFAGAGTLKAQTYSEYPPFENRIVQAYSSKGTSTLDRHECRSLKQRNLHQPVYCIIR